MNSIKVCEYSRSRSFHDDLILQDQASGERSQDQWSSGFPSYCILKFLLVKTETQYGVVGNWKSTEPQCSQGPVFST